jgi:hypothetical protein
VRIAGREASNVGGSHMATKFSSGDSSPSLVVASPLATEHFEPRLSDALELMEPIEPDFTFLMKNIPYYYPKGYGM